MKPGISPPENLNVTSIETDELVAQQISSLPEHWLIDTGQNYSESAGAGAKYNKKAISTMEEHITMNT